jgi:hypothetical protein
MPNQTTPGKGLKRSPLGHYESPELRYTDGQGRIGANYIVAVGFTILALVAGIITLVLQR